MALSISAVTPDVTARVERFHTDFNVARMAALGELNGNPYQVEVRAFGGDAITGGDAARPVWACKSKSPLLGGKNRLSGLHAAHLPLLDDLLRFFREDGLPCSFTFYGRMTPEAFDRLTRAGLWSGGGGTVSVAKIAASQTGGGVGFANCVAPPGVTVREAEPDDKDLYLGVFQQAFGERAEGQADYLAFQWTEDTLWNARRYIAFVDGVPAAMASLLIRDGVGFFGTAGTVPAFRGRGLHAALIARRIADASALGCDLVLGGAAPFSAPRRNFERAGLRSIPLGMGWSDRAPVIARSQR